MTTPQTTTEPLTCDFCGGSKTKPWTRYCGYTCQGNQNTLDYLMRKKLRMQKENSQKRK